MAVTPSKYCSHSPFLLFLPLNITIDTKLFIDTIQNVPLLLPSDIVYTDLG